MIGYNEKQERENLQELFRHMEHIHNAATADFSDDTDEAIVHKYAALALEVLQLHISGKYPLNFYRRKNTLRSIHTLLATQEWPVDGSSTALEDCAPGLTEEELHRLERRIAMVEQIEPSWLVLENLMEFAEKICETQNPAALARWIRDQKWQKDGKGKQKSQTKKPAAYIYDVLDNDYSAIERVAEQWNVQPMAQSVIRLPKDWVDKYAPETALLAAVIYRTGKRLRGGNPPDSQDEAPAAPAPYLAIPHGQSSLGRYDPGSKTADRFFSNACKGQSKRKNKLMHIRKFHGMTVIALDDTAVAAMQKIDMPTAPAQACTPAVSITEETPADLQELLGKVRMLYQMPAESPVRAEENPLYYQVEDRGGCEPLLAFQDRKATSYTLALHRLLMGEASGAEAIRQLKLLIAAYLIRQQSAIKKSDTSVFRLQSFSPSNWQFELIKRTLAFLCPCGGQMLLAEPVEQSSGMKEIQLSQAFLQLWDEKIAPDSGAALCAFIGSSQPAEAHEILLTINQKQHTVRCFHLPTADASSGTRRAVADWLSAGVHEHVQPAFSTDFAAAFADMAATGLRRFCLLWRSADHPKAEAYQPAPDAQTNGKFCLDRAEDAAFRMVCRYILCQAMGQPGCKVAPIAPVAPAEPEAAARLTIQLVAKGKVHKVHTLGAWCSLLLEALQTQTVRACCDCYASTLYVTTKKTAAGDAVPVFKIQAAKQKAAAAQPDADTAETCQP